MPPAHKSSGCKVIVKMNKGKETADAPEAGVQLSSTSSKPAATPETRTSNDHNHTDDEWYYGPYPCTIPKPTTTSASQNDKTPLSIQLFGGDIHAELRHAKAERARLQDRLDLQDNYIVALQAALEAKRVRSKMGKSQCSLVGSVEPSK